MVCDVGGRPEPFGRGMSSTVAAQRQLVHQEGALFQTWQNCRLVVEVLSTERFRFWVLLVGMFQVSI